MKNNSSEKLLAQYVQGSPSETVAASIEIHSRYLNRLIALAQNRLLGILKSKVDADDIAQEAFVAFFAMADRDEIKWKERGDLWRLLAGIAINKVKQQFERYSTLKRDLRTESQVAVTIEVGEQDVNELAELVEHVISSENPLIGKVLNLRLAGFSFEEIAERVGRSTRTIRRLLESLKAKLIVSEELGFRLAGEPSKAVVKSVDYHDFDLLRMIGQGSFAKVYLAKQVSTGQLFAIKSIKKKWLTNEQARQSFYREAELLMTLSDPCFVKTYGIGQLPNGGCFLLLELIQGKSLEAVVRTASQGMRLSWLNQIREAVERLHSAGFVHGDICLSNVMIDRDGQIKLLDFGLGRRTAGQKIGVLFDQQQLELLCGSILSIDND